MDYYIVFAGIVEVGFSTRLFTAINKAGTSGATKIIIFLSSLGGNIQEGFTLASIIQNSKIPIAIHANNNIDSIANVIYMSARELRNRTRNFTCMARLLRPQPLTKRDCGNRCCR
jgi:ATP-dependent protease ClpP protease subunit